MLHGAIAWLVTVPGLLVVAGLGAGGYLGVWYSGLAASPPWAPQATPTVENAAAALAARNAALGALTALLLGLVGSVVGGWMGSGEPMTFHRSKRPHRQPGGAWERRDDLHPALASRSTAYAYSDPVSARGRAVVRAR